MVFLLSYSQTVFSCAGPVPFALQHRIKAHARIIWGVSWSWDSKLFATASRDGIVKVWCNIGLNSTSKPIATISVGQPVTAVAFTQQHGANASSKQHESQTHQYMLALGSETGIVSIWQLQHSAEEASSSCVWQSSLQSSHCAPVRRLCWQSNTKGSGDVHSRQRQSLLATCADDHCIRIFNVYESN